MWYAMLDSLCLMFSRLAAMASHSPTVSVSDIKKRKIIPEDDAKCEVNISTLVQKGVPVSVSTTPATPTAASTAAASPRPDTDAMAKCRRELYENAMHLSHEMTVAVDEIKDAQVRLEHYSAQLADVMEKIRLEDSDVGSFFQVKACRDAAIARRFAERKVRIASGEYGRRDTRLAMCRDTKIVTERTIDDVVTHADDQWPDENVGECVRQNCERSRI